MVVTDSLLAARLWARGRCLGNGGDGQLAACVQASRGPVPTRALGVRDTHIVAPQHSKVEGQQLQGDDAENALQAVHGVRHLDRAARVRDRLVVVPVADNDGPALEKTTNGVSYSVFHCQTGGLAGSNS